MVQNPDAAVISERWSEVLTHRPFWQWSSVALVIRLTPFMVALGFVAATIGALDSEAVGGLMVAGYVLANFIAPINGRIHDHFGPARSLPWQLALGSLAFLALTIAVQQRWPAGALVALAAACGLITAGMSGALRATLGEFIPGGRIQRALAIDAFFTELAVVIAPLIVLVATLQVFWGGIAVMALFTGSGAIGAIWLRNRVRGVAVSPVAHDRVQLPGADDRSLWTNPQFILWVLVSVSFGQVLGTLETGALPITIRYGMDSIWAVMLIAVAASLSVALGVLYASVAERLRWPEPVQAMVMLLAMAIGCFCLAIPNAWVAIVIGAALIGACTSPVNIIRQTATERTVSPSRRAEAFGALFAANGVGFGLAGLSLAVMPLGWMLAAGGTTSLLSIVFWLLIGRHAGGPSGPAVEPA